MKKERVSVYDWLRLIATVLVVIGHSRYIAMDASNGGVHYVMPEFTNPAYYSYFISFFGLMVSYIYSFHMPLFFFLSGAVLRLKPLKSLDNFVVDKSKRLLIPYFLTGLFFMLPVKYFAGFYSKEGLHCAYRTYYNGSDSGHLWFLTALFWCMLILVILIKILQRFHVKSEILVLFLGMMVQMSSDIVPFDILALKQGLGYVGWFALGYVFERLRSDKIVLWVPWKKVTACILLGILFVLNIKVGIFDDHMNTLCGIFFSYFTAETCALLFKRLEHTGIYRVVMGNLFAVYLFHDPLEYLILRVFMTNTYLASAMGCYLYVFLRIIGVIVISIVFGEILKGFLKLCKKKELL